MEDKIKADLMMECLLRYGQMSQAEKGNQIGVVEYSRFSQLRRYLREALQKDSQWQRVFKDLTLNL